MDPKRIGLFDLAERRLAWADRRQAVLAQNIANANTPRFKPHDLKSFATTLGDAVGVAQVRTHPNHLTGTAGVAQDVNQDERSAVPLAAEDMATQLVSQYSEGW